MTESQFSWDLDQALFLIRNMQRFTYDAGFHIALGGGVLNGGFSDNDLDLYVLPLGSSAHNLLALNALLDTFLGERFTLGGPKVSPMDIERAYPPDPFWEHGRFTFYPNGKRVDVFIA